MNKEELGKEAEAFVSEKADKGNFDVEKFGKAYFSESSMKQALVKFAEPREKRIEDLETRCNELFLQTNEQAEQIEKMKCCTNCKHSRTEYEHCRTDKHEKWELKEIEK